MKHSNHLTKVGLLSCCSPLTYLYNLFEVLSSWSVERVDVSEISSRNYQWFQLLSCLLVDHSSFQRFYCEELHLLVYLSTFYNILCECTLVLSLSLLKKRSGRVCSDQTGQPSRFWRDSPAFLPDVPRPAKSWNVPLFARSRIFFLRLPRCPDVNVNHPIERNYGNSVRFLAKIPNGTAAESPCILERN